MNNKRVGTRNEHKTMKLLESLGYRCTRAAASLGVWDVIGIGATDVVVVQVKTTNWPRPAEMEGMREFHTPHNVRKLIHRWRKFQRQPDVRDITGEAAS